MPNLRTGTNGAQLGSTHVNELGNLLKASTRNYCTDSVFYIVKYFSILKAHFNTIVFILYMYLIVSSQMEDFI